jgi:hypothetical protein
VTGEEAEFTATVTGKDSGVLASVRTRRVVRLLPHKAGTLIAVDVSAGLPAGLIKVDA